MIIGQDKWTNLQDANVSSSPSRMKKMQSASLVSSFNSPGWN